MVLEIWAKEGREKRNEPVCHCLRILLGSSTSFCLLFPALHLYLDQRPRSLATNIAHLHIPFLVPTICSRLKVYIVGHSVESVALAAAVSGANRAVRRDISPRD